MCEGDKKALNLYYNDILEAQKDDSVLIIDVREQSEIDETGKLPGSIHIPSVYIYMLYLWRYHDVRVSFFGTTEVYR